MAYDTVVPPAKHHVIEPLLHQAIVAHRDVTADRGCYEPKAAGPSRRACAIIVPGSLAQLVEHSTG